MLPGKDSVMSSADRRSNRAGPSCEWPKLHQEDAVLDAAQDALKVSALPTGCCSADATQEV
jgi:hypothetical protein